jgi:hypothetical protein
VKASDVLKNVRGLASANRIIVSGHARVRMRERNVTYADLQSALGNATRCRCGNDDRWNVVGPDLDGEELTVIVIVESDLIVVTVY